MTLAYHANDQPPITRTPTMPWTPLTPKLKRHADKLARTKKATRPACWTHRRQDLARQHKLGFVARIKFWLRASK